jgi:hypothetical protein
MVQSAHRRPAAAQTQFLMAGRKDTMREPLASGRWVASVKEQLILAVRSGAVTLDDVRSTYSLSPEEFRAWEEAYNIWGAPGLRVTRQQIYREATRTAGVRLTTATHAGGLPPPRHISTLP